MKRTSFDIKDAYLKSELDSEAMMVRVQAHAPLRVPSDPSPTSAPTVVGVTEPGSDTGTATTEADRVCSARNTQEMADGLQTAGASIASITLTRYRSTHDPVFRS